MILFFIVKVVFLTSFILDSKIMLRKIKLVLLLFLLSSTDVLGKDNKSRLSLGGGIYNFMKHGSDDFNQSSIAYNPELFSGKKYQILSDRLLVF